MATAVTPPDGELRRQARAWAWWDWGSAAFNAVIVTFVFSVYLTDGVGEDLPGSVSASSWLAWSVAAGGLVVGVLAPVAGRRSDAAGRRKRSVVRLTFVVTALTAALFFVREDPDYLWFGLLLLGVASICFELSQVPYYAMLRQVSTPQTVGRTSAVGWAFGYLGGIVLLLVCYAGFVVGDGGLLGLPTEDGLNIRLIAVLAALWFLGFAIPLMLRVPELPATDAGIAPVGLRESYRRVFADVATLWATDRDTIRFLIASALYRDGLAAVFSFGAVIAVSVYGLSDDDVLLFGVAANVVAAGAAVWAGRVDDDRGPRVVIVTSIAAMLAMGGVLLLVDGPLWFWVFGLVLCLFVGPAQSSSRSFLLRLADDGAEGRLFGLYSMAGKAASFLSPLLFGLLAWIGGDDRWGILGIMVVLGAGLLLLLRVPPPRPREA